MTAGPGQDNFGYINDESSNADRTNSQQNNEKIDKNERQNWGKSIEFLFSCIAMSVGLGNIWRFPLAALKNGGGAFVIPYLIVLYLVGRPIYFVEMVIGQFSSRGTIKVYDFAPALRGIGVGQVLSTFFVSTYYCSIIAITMRYLFGSFKAVLPWSVCSESWTDVFCQPSGEIEIKYPNKSAIHSAALYFGREIVKEKSNIDDGIGNPNWELVICLAISWTIVFIVVCKGIVSSGKASYVLALFPYVVLIILFIRTITLPGVWDGIVIFFNPQWEKMLDYNVWFDAVTQVFFSLNICFGCVNMFASYNKFNHNIYRDINVISILDTCTSLLAGTITFGILGHIKYLTGEDVFKSIEGGPGLAFVTYPDALAKFTILPQLFAVLFFLMLVSLGIGSITSMSLCAISVIRDKYPTLQNWKIALLATTLGFSIGNIYLTPGGMHLLNIVDFFGAQWVAFIFAIAELLAIFYVYGAQKFYSDLYFMLGFKPGMYFRYCWQFISPGIMIAIFVYTMVKFELPLYNNQQYPTGVYIFGWLLTTFCLIQLPIFAIISIVNRKENSLKDKFLAACQPLPSWGPKDPLLKAQYDVNIAIERKSSMV